MAAEYGWSARHIERELTDEMLVLYLDTAAARISSREDARVVRMIETVRAGTIFAHDAKAHASWLRKRKAPSARGLSGAALERAVGGFAMTHPEYVVHGVA